LFHQLRFSFSAVWLSFKHLCGGLSSQMISRLLSLCKDLTSANARDLPQMKTATWTVVVVVFTLCITWVSCYSKHFLLMHTTGYLSVKTEGSDEWALSTVVLWSYRSVPPEAWSWLWCTSDFVSYLELRISESPWSSISDMVYDFVTHLELWISDAPPWSSVSDVVCVWLCELYLDLLSLN
jgi:hypothetical protein